MAFKPPGFVLVLAALLALALVPGAGSAPDNGAGGEPLDIALSYLSENAAAVGVTPADVDDLFVTSITRSKHSGVTHVNLNQRYRGLEVFGGHGTVSIGPDGAVVFAAGSLVRSLAKDASGQAELGATEAVEAAAEGLDLQEPANLRVLGRSDGNTVVSRGGISEEAVPTRLGWQPTEGGLRLAWQVTIDDSASVDLWNAAVDAESGKLLDAANWT